MGENHHEKPVCQVCRKPEALSPAIALFLVYAPGLAKPYPLLPAEDYVACSHDRCESIVRLIIRAIDAHPATRQAAVGWTQAWVLFQDPSSPAWRILPPKLPTVRA